MRYVTKHEKNIIRFGSMIFIHAMQANNQVALRNIALIELVIKMSFNNQSSYRCKSQEYKPMKIEHLMNWLIRTCSTLQFAKTTLASHDNRLACQIKTATKYVSFQADWKHG